MKWANKTYVMFCTIWYHLYKFENMKSTHRGDSLLVTKINTPPWVLFTFLNCTNGTNSRKASDFLCTSVHCTVEKIKFSIKDFFSRCDRIRRKLQIRSHLLKKSLIGNFIFSVASLQTVLTNYALYLRESM